MPAPRPVEDARAMWEAIPPNGATYKQLAQLWNMDAANVYRALDRMEQRYGLLLSEDERRVGRKTTTVIFRFE